MNFGEKVRAARRELGLTQRELAEKAGVSLRSIASYESNQALPRTREATRRLAEALGVTSNYLLTEEETFLVDAEEQFGPRGRRGAEKLVREITGLFAGGEMAEEDMDALMFAIQDAYVQAKKRNQKYTPKKYRKE